MVPGVGAALSQALLDNDGVRRQIIREGLVQQLAPSDIIDNLEQLAPGHQTRQYGIATLLHPPATFTGSQTSQWAGKSLISGMADFGSVAIVFPPPLSREY